MLMRGQSVPRPDSVPNAFVRDRLMTVKIVCLRREALTIGPTVHSIGERLSGPLLILFRHRC